MITPDVDFRIPLDWEKFRDRANCYFPRRITRNQSLLYRLIGYEYSAISELPNLFLVGATAGYPSVSGVISKGMDVVEMQLTENYELILS